MSGTLSQRKSAELAQMLVENQGTSKNLQCSVQHTRLLLLAIRAVKLYAYLCSL